MMKIIAQIPGSIVAFFVAVAGAETITFETRRSAEMTNGSLERRVDDNSYGIASTLQLTAAASRKTHGAHQGAGTFDINLPLTGEPGVECRTADTDGNHTLVFTFSNNVVSGSASVTSGTVNGIGSASFDGPTMTVEVIGVANARQITVTLSDVTDLFGQVLPSFSTPSRMRPGLFFSFARGVEGAAGPLNSKRNRQVEAEQHMRKLTAQSRFRFGRPQSLF